MILPPFTARPRQAISDLPGDSLRSERRLGPAARQYAAAIRRGASAARATSSQVRRVFETGKPAISDLFVGQVMRRPIVAIDVPVRRDDKVAFALAMGIFPERLGEILKVQKIKPDWVVAIFDSRARSSRAVAQQSSSSGRKARRARASAWRRLPRDASRPTRWKESRSWRSSAALQCPSGRWRSAFRAAPSPALCGPRSRWIIAGAVVLLLGGMVMAQRVGSRIAGSIRGLIPPAVALGRGDPVVVPPLHLREADDVGRELVSASERLHDRERTLALVSHDLRSPLHAIMMGAATIERLAQRLPGGEPIRVLAASHADTTRRMSGMVDDLLAIAVATSGGRSLLKIATVSAASLLERAADAARPLFADQGIELEIEALGELPEIQVDSDRVLRVFANLLDNALKFTDRQGRVVLRAWAEVGRGALLRGE